MNTPLERLEISKLINFIDLGNPPDDNAVRLMSNAWVRVALQEKTRMNLANYMKNMKQHVNVFIVVSQKPHAIIPAYRIEKWHSSFIQFGIHQDQSVINLIITDKLEKIGGELVPPTAWMILHMMFQTIFEEYPIGKDPWSRLWDNLLKQVYGSRKERKNVIVHSNLMEKVFTFRSARTGQLLDMQEGLIDLMVQVTTGRGALNEFPVISGNEPVSNASKLGKKFLHKFLKVTQKHLKEVQGKYIFT